MNFKKELLSITTIFFKDTTDYFELSNAIKNYKNLLVNLTKEELDNELYRDNIQLESGVAIGTIWAASCIDDVMRTHKFMKGINLAIQEKVYLKDPLNILYAGTGPFATLLLPFILKYSELNIKYTLMEINTYSFKILKKLMQSLDIKTSNINFVNDDATKYKIPTNNIPDIIISETMMAALDKEQQVSIFYNLMKQANPDTVFIPEKIALFIGTKDVDYKESTPKEDHYRKYNKIFEVSKEAMNSDNWSIEKDTSKLDFAKKEVILTEKNSRANEILIMTEITVYKTIKLMLNESGLTAPKTVQVFSNNKETLTIESQYIISDNPGLDLKFT